MKRDLTTGELASILGVAPRTVGKWCDSGKIRCHRLPGGNDRRITERDLRDFMRKHGFPLSALDGEAPKSLLLVTHAESLANAVAREMEASGGTAKHVWDYFDVAATSRTQDWGYIVVDLAQDRRWGIELLRHLRSSVGRSTVLSCIAGEDERERELLAELCDVVFTHPVNAVLLMAELLARAPAAKDVTPTPKSPPRKGRPCRKN